MQLIVLIITRLSNSRGSLPLDWQPKNFNKKTFPEGCYTEISWGTIKSSRISPCCQ